MLFYIKILQQIYTKGRYEEKRGKRWREKLCGNCCINNIILASYLGICPVGFHRYP